MVTILLCDGHCQAAIAQLGERQTEDLKVPGSITGLGKKVISCVPRGTEGRVTPRLQTVDRRSEMDAWTWYLLVITAETVEKLCGLCYTA